jgi:hypothetical protein
MKSFVTKLALCGLVLSTFTVNAFGKRHKLPPDPRFVAIDQIVILPVVDSRADKKDSVNLESLRKMVVIRLKHKNYTVSTTENIGTVGEILEDDFNNATPWWIKRLGPPDARYVMIVGIGEAHSKITFGSTGNAELFGYLFNKQDESVLWKGTGVGQAGQGGLMGMAMKGMMREEALENAMNNLLVDIPTLPKKGK